MDDKDKNDGFYIYCHVRPDTNQVFYVGKGRDRRAYSKKNRNKHWHNIVNKAGGFEVQILAENLIESLAFELEVELIKKFRDSGVKLCNLTDGGEGMSGWKHSEETKKKISEKSKGYIHTLDSKNKIRQSKMGLVISDDAKEKIRKKLTGRKLTKLHISNIKKKIKRGEDNPMFGDKHPKSRRIIQIDKISGKIINTFTSIKSAKRELNIDSGDISKCCKGLKKSAGGFIWRYAD